MRRAAPSAPVRERRTANARTRARNSSADSTASILLSTTIEGASADRAERLPLVPPLLEPLRVLLKDTPWLGGKSPNYTDYCILAVFLWTASVASIPPLHADDPLKDYIDRGFDLYGGLGRHPGMHNLFGLPKPATQETAA